MSGWMRKAELARYYGVNPKTILRWSNGNPDFPKPYRIGEGVTAWKRAEVEEYDRTLLEEARA